MGNWWPYPGAILLVLQSLTGASAQAVLAAQQCQTVYQGVPIQGHIQLEDWTAYHGTHRLYGLFHDPAGNQYEFEVFTNQWEGGVGGLWINNARHREIHIQVRTHPGGFTIASEDGIAVDYACQ
jgi:hypothetical protein